MVVHFISGHLIMQGDRSVNDTRKSITPTPTCRMSSVPVHNVWLYCISLSRVVLPWHIHKYKYTIRSQDVERSGEQGCDHVHIVYHILRTVITSVSSNASADTYVLSTQHKPEHLPSLHGTHRSNASMEIPDLGRTLCPPLQSCEAKPIASVRGLVLFHKRR
jgi:hypothetical protein